MPIDPLLSSPKGEQCAKERRTTHFTLILRGSQLLRRRDHLSLSLLQISLYTFSHWLTSIWLITRIWLTCSTFRVSLSCSFRAEKLFQTSWPVSVQLFRGERDSIRKQPLEQAALHFGGRMIFFFYQPGVIIKVYVLYHTMLYTYKYVLSKGTVCLYS